MAGICAIVGTVCPRTSDPEAERFCPAWWESLWQNDRGETQVRKGCAWTQLPDYVNQLVARSNGAAVSAQAARDASDGMAINLRALALTLFNRGHNGEAPILLSAGDEVQGSRASDLPPANVSESGGSVQQS